MGKASDAENAEGLASEVAAATAGLWIFYKNRPKPMSGWQAL